MGLTSRAPLLPSVVYIISLLLAIHTSSGKFWRQLSDLVQSLQIYYQVFCKEWSYTLSQIPAEFCGYLWRINTACSGQRKCALPITRLDCSVTADRKRQKWYTYLIMPDSLRPQHGFTGQLLCISILIRKQLNWGSWTESASFSLACLHPLICFLSRSPE